MNFHQLSPPSVTLTGDRAIIDMPCVLLSFSQLDGVDVNQIGHAHLLWRARRMDRKWLIAGLRSYYVRDSLIACNPTRTPKLDEVKLAGFRQSYRYLSYILDSLGGRVRDDLPGVDRPETVDALYAAERYGLAPDTVWAPAASYGFGWHEAPSTTTDRRNLARSDNPNTIGTVGCAAMAFPASASDPLSSSVSRQSRSRRRSNASAKARPQSDVIAGARAP